MKRKTGKRCNCINCRWPHRNNGPRNRIDRRIARSREHQAIKQYMTGYKQDIDLVINIMYR